MPYAPVGYIARVATQFDVASATAVAAVTDLIIPAADAAQGAIIERGGIYEYEASLMCTTAVDAGVKVAIMTGGSPVITVTAIRGQIEIVDGGAAVPVTNARQTALGTGGGVTAVTVPWVYMRGCFVVNVVGPVAVGFAQNASQVSTTSVLTQSVFKLWRVDSFYQGVWQTPA